MIRPSLHQWACGSNTRDSKDSALRGSTPEPMAAARTWYSSRPSCRLRVCDETTTGASSSSMVTSMVMIARCRWVKETIRRDATWTRLPDGVRQMMSRRNKPARKSNVRSYCSRSATESSIGSSSTYSFIVLLSGTLTMVCPTRAKPKASSACRMGQTSWKPLTKVPWAWVSRPSSTLPRIPR